jgi:hypothetical protein
VLDFGKGRRLSINFRGQMLERFKNKRFSENDDMTFFNNTPLPQIGGRARMKLDFPCPLFVFCQSCSWKDPYAETKWR